ARRLRECRDRVQPAMDCSRPRRQRRTRPPWSGRGAAAGSWRPRAAWLREHSMSRIDETRPFIPVRIAVLTVSDTRGLEEDRSGQTLAERIEAAGHVLAARDIVQDDVERIRERVRSWCAD